MKEIFVIKSPLEFLRLEGEVNTTLSFVDSEVTLVDDVLTGRSPAYNVVGEHIVETFLIATEIDNIKTTLLFPVSTIEFDTKLVFVENITDPTIASYSKINWFIAKESVWLIGRFNTWYEANRIYKCNITYPTSRDFNEFIRWVHDSGCRSRKEVINKFDYKNFW